MSTKNFILRRRSLTALTWAIRLVLTADYLAD